MNARLRGGAQALLPLPPGPTRCSGAMWRRHSCLPRPDSSGRFSGVHSVAGSEGAFVSAVSRLIGTLWDLLPANIPGPSARNASTRVSTRQARVPAPQLFLLLCASPAWAHVVSMSSGDLTITQTRAHYELRMPQYEIAHVSSPERVLLEHIRFSSGGRDARLLSQTCAPDSARVTYVCEADYEFSAPVEHLDVECTFPAVTVPNHVHQLRVVMGAKRDQALFDISFPRATLRFRPPTPLETAIEESGAGCMRALGGAVQILFLAALVLAARSLRELLALTGMFLAGQIAAVLVVPYTAWLPAPRFVEAAAALTIAYLAVEILLLPQAGSRWLVAGALGAFHGLYFHLFLQTTGYHPSFVLAGAALAEMAIIAVLALIFSRVGRMARALRPLQVSASGLLVFGMTWFILRLRG